MRAYYNEEIVWLYNECGILCHMQGRLPNAMALFERADAAAHTIEPFAEGALRTQINLNRALTNIERGRLEIAERDLRDILGIPDEDPVVKLIATGLRGVVHHLRGRHRSAEQDYADALGMHPVGFAHQEAPAVARDRGLIGRDRSRASSIFARHYGDLLRAQRNFVASTDMIAQSITLAIEGGHEDVHHLAQLSKIRLAIESESRADFGGMHRDLDVIEDYAVVMGMVRMQCEVDLTRTELYKRGGDLKAAARIASRGLTIATSNGLRLRKTSFLLHLAAIAHAQGRTHECRPLLQEAFEIARDTEHHMARARGQKLWAQIATTSTPV